MTTEAKTAREAFNRIVDGDLQYLTTLSDDEIIDLADELFCDEDDQESAVVPTAQIIPLFPNATSLATTPTSPIQARLPAGEWRKIWSFALPAMIGAAAAMVGFMVVQLYLIGFSGETKEPVAMDRINEAHSVAANMDFVGQKPRSRPRSPRDDDGILFSSIEIAAVQTLEVSDSPPDRFYSLNTMLGMPLKVSSKKNTGGRLLEANWGSPHPIRSIAPGSAYEPRKMHE